jgi:electron transfer flavoprotein beta subunit
LLLGPTASLLGSGVSCVERRFVKIGVFVKQVPAKDAPLAIADASAWIRESDIGFETNEPDGFALEEALRLKEKHGGEVVAISMGPERAKQAIKEALAKGAERGIHVADNEFYKLDPLTSARSLAAAVEKEDFDLILTGLQSEDQGFGQTGVLLAELLGRPHATIIMAIEVAGGGMKLKRELEAGWFQWVELPLPAVITIQSGINKPRYATLKGIMAAKKKEIATVERASLGVADARTQRVERIYVPQKTKKTEFISGTAKEAAAKLIEKLRHEARVL